MLDVKFVRDNYETVKAKLAKRGENISEFDQFEPLDQKRRELIAKTELLKAERNEFSQKISEMKRNKENADDINYAYA